MWAGRPAEALSEFYSSIFAQILQASQSASKDKFEHAVECVRNVRDAWRQVAIDPEVNPAPPQLADFSSSRNPAEFENSDYGADSAVVPGGMRKSREQGTETGAASRQAYPCDPAFARQMTLQDLEAAKLASSRTCPAELVCYSLISDL